MGLHVSKHKGRAEARKSIELVAETGPEVHKRVLVQLANRLTHDKIKSPEGPRRTNWGDQEFDSEELGEFSRLGKKSQSVAGKEDCEGSISSSKAPGGWRSEEEKGGWGSEEEKGGWGSEEWTAWCEKVEQNGLQGHQTHGKDLN